MLATPLGGLGLLGAGLSGENVISPGIHTNKSRDAPRLGQTVIGCFSQTCWGFWRDLLTLVWEEATFTDPMGDPPVLNSQEAEEGRIRENQANALCQHCFGGSHKMTLLRCSFLICQIGIIRVISPLLSRSGGYGPMPSFQSPRGWKGEQDEGGVGSGRRGQGKDAAVRG